MKQLLSLSHNEVTYLIAIQDGTVLKVHKVFEDSGISREVSFSVLSERVQELILDLIENA